MTPAAQDAHGLEDFTITKIITNTIYQVQSYKTKNEIKYNQILNRKNNYITIENEKINKFQYYQYNFQLCVIIQKNIT